MRKPDRPTGTSAPSGGQSRSIGRDVFVIGAMLLVAAALGVGLHVQFGLGEPAAALSAAAAWALLLTLHLIATRLQSAAARAEARQRSRDNLDLRQAALGRAGQNAADPAESEVRSGPPPLPGAGRRAQSHNTALDLLARASAQQAEGADRVPAPHVPPKRAEGANAPPPGFGWDVRPGREHQQLTGTTGAAGGPVPQSGGAVRTLADQRLLAERQEPLFSANARTAPPANRRSEPGEAALAQSRDARAPDRPAPAADDAKATQALIEQIARQLTAPAGSPLANAAAESQARDGPEASIAQSIEALKTAGGALRAAAAQPRNAAPAAGHQTRNAPVAAARPSVMGHSELSAAIANDRVDTYLDYICGLGDRKTRHFEITVRPRAEDGRLLDASDYAQLPATLCGKLDAAKLIRLANIAERLNNRGTTAALFATLVAPSLTDDAFLETCANIIKNETAIGRQFVLSFTQSDVRTFSRPHWETLATLSENGLRFAVEATTDLAMDLGVLKSRGFDFIKLGAQVLLSGMQSHDGLVPAAESRRRVAAAGVELVAVGIDDEATFAEVAGLGIQYGQGTLFGSARAVKIDLKPHEAAA